MDTEYFGWHGYCIFMIDLFCIITMVTIYLYNLQYLCSLITTCLSHLAGDEAGFVSLWLKRSCIVTCRF